jgi:hypothetical protein
MTYEIYRYIFLGAAILCGLMFVVSVLLFFLLRIPAVIGDLTGRTAKKAIESMRNQNESSGAKTYQSSHVNKERGKLTDKISHSGRIIKNPTDPLSGAMATAKIGTQKLTSQDTVVLDSGNETTVLAADSFVGGNETTVLSEPAFNTGNETTVLTQNNNMTSVFAVEYEITYIHTNEVATLEVS